MSVKVSVDVTGLHELEQALQELGSEVAGTKKEIYKCRHP